MLRYRQDQMEQFRPDRRARHIAGVDFDDVLAEEAWICGTSGELTGYLKDIERRYSGSSTSSSASLSA
jgi:hypothetical protein